MTPNPTLQLQLALKRERFELNVNLELPAQGITVLFGPSGSGKTTLLRCVAGLEQASGRVALGPQLWQESASGHMLSTWRRALGYVFQESSLFEHLNVEGNLRFGLRRSVQSAKVLRMSPVLELLGIAQLLNRWPVDLSGGERQRVALARALLTQPELLLLDEPLASLDRARRHEVLPWLERLHAELKLPMLYVTHSVDELARLADHAVLLKNGRCTLSAAIEDFMLSPEVTQLLGDEAGAVLHGTVLERHALDHLCKVQVGGESLWLRDTGAAIGHRLRLRVLARDVGLTRAAVADSSVQNQWPAVIEALLPEAHPSSCLVRLRCAAGVVLARVTKRSVQQLGLCVGDALWCQVKSVALMG